MVNVAVVVPAFPSVTATSLIEIVGSESSLTIVPTPRPSPIVALLGSERLTLKISFGSKLVSPLIVTLTGRDVWPGKKVTVPLDAT